jgi:hypothetical protein
MKVKILLLFIALSLSVGAQNYINVNTLVNAKFKSLSVDFNKNINKTIIVGIGAGVLSTDSIKINEVDVNGVELPNIKTYNLVIPISITVKTNTKILYAYCSGKNLLSISNPIALMGILGLGYEYKHFRTQLGVSFYKLAPGISYEAGITF